MVPNQPGLLNTIAFVGEAPGEDEVDAGVPLVGPSGRIFNAMLRSANIDRQDHWVGNVFLEKAPDNNCSEWIQDPEVWAPAVSRLRDELMAARPTVVVPMGGTALRALTGSDAISQARGNVMNDGVFKILPTYHPAFVMRQWKYYSVVIGDFLRAVQQAEFPEIRLPKRKLILEPNLDDITDWAYMFKAKLNGPLSVDLETGWGFITCVGFAPTVEEGICIPFTDIRKPNKAYWATAEEEVYAWKLVRQVMESGVPKLGQNFGGYDTSWFLRYGIAPRNYSEDTRLLHHAIYPELPKDLAFMGASYGEQGAWKMMRQKRKEKKDD